MDAKKILKKLFITSFVFVKFQDICAPGKVQYMNKVYLLIGGNVGDRLQNLGRAVEWLNEGCGTITGQSGIYETAAWGNTSQPAFLNQALQLITPYASQKLMYKILQTEQKMGRKRLEKYGPRVIDIDILFYNNDIIHKPHLTVPHPEIQNRRFVLAPMNELAPQLVHPVLKKTIAQLLEECGDTLEVKRLVV